MSDNAGDNVTFKVSNEALLKALKKALADDSSDSTDDLLCLIVSRLVDTADTFNEHEHPVSVQTESNEYTSAGSGHTSAPAESGGFGCNKPIKCGACGSIWIDPVSEEGKLDLKNEGSNLTHVSRNPDGSKGH